MADYGPRLGAYPVPCLEGYRQEKPVASRGRRNLLPAAGAIPRFGCAGFGLQSGRGPSGYGEKRPVAVWYASAIDRDADRRRDCTNSFRRQARASDLVLSSAS